MQANDHLEIIREALDNYLSWVTDLEELGLYHETPDKPPAIYKRIDAASKWLDTLDTPAPAAQVHFEPVEDGFEMECENPTWKLYASEGDIGVVNAEDRNKEHYVYARRHNLYLCRRTQPAPSVPQPDWTAAPEWAEWWAKNEDGREMWYENEPHLDPKYDWWLNSHNGGYSNSRHIKFDNWRTLKQRRPSVPQATGGDDE